MNSKSNPKQAVAKSVTDPAASAQAFVPIVAMGASAGGLDAFKRFFNIMAANSGLVFVLIQHLDPDHQSLTGELLASHTGMPVAEVAAPTPVAPDHIYLIPPGKYLTIRAGVLSLTEPVLHHNLRMPIDYFFRALAQDQQEKAIGIVLSGTGTDGTLGLQAIKDAGGLVLTQTPQTAGFDGMPRSAIATGLVDDVLPVEDMPAVLISYAAGVYIKSAGRPVTTDGATVDLLPAILSVLNTRTGYDFRHYKKSTLMRRIEQRMSFNHLDTLADYLAFVQAQQAEADLLRQNLLIGVTCFFRDPQAFLVLEQQIVPQLLLQKNNDSDQNTNTPLRVWVPACASGEEAYSIAIVLSEQLELAARQNYPLQIFASDINEGALARARAGIYPENIAADFSAQRLQRFFTRTGHSCRIRQFLREIITFAQHDLLSDPPFSRMDLISCRNLLIYLEPAAQSKILALFHYALNPGGYLLLGTAEQISQQPGLFEPVDSKWRLYRRLANTDGRLGWPVTSDYAYIRAKSARTTAVPSPARLPAYDSGELTRQILLQNYAPASVLINRNHRILYFCGATDDYLWQPDGAPTDDLLVRIRENLRGRLRSVLRKARQKQQRAAAGAVFTDRDGSRRRINIVVSPVEPAPGSEELYLVSFEVLPDVLTAGVDHIDADDVGTTLSRELEDELKLVREDLQNTIEEQEFSNEELRAANEEILSVNEELQSTNEELETSREEAQSLNEELTTINQQLREKMTEQEVTNNDLINLLSSTDIATLFLDSQLRIKSFTPATSWLFNLIEADTGRFLGDITCNLPDATLLQDARKVLEQLVPCEQELGSGDGRWYVRRILPYRTTDNRIEGVVVTWVDISERKRAEVVMQDARLYAEDIVETVREPLIILDQECRVLTANAAFYQTFRVTSQEIRNVSLHRIGSGQWDQPELRQLLEKVIIGNHVFSDYELACEFPAIGSRTMLLNARQIERRPGQPKRILLAIEDVTQARKLAAQMHYEARHDLLTGLENRREFELRLARVVENARSNGTEHALMYLDLDQFKVINDSCGHSAGDELLRQLGSLLSEHVRTRDLVARLGGDEFGLVLEHCSLERARHIGEALRQAVEAFVFVWEQQIFRIGVSIGLVAVTRDTGDVVELLKAADAACYAAKDSGRNRLRVYHHEDIELARRHGEMQWVTRLRQALEEDRFRLYRQRILPLHDNTADAAHYEILVRLIDEQGNLVLPVKFLGAAERYGLAISVDRWVVRTAIDWLNAQPGHLEQLVFCNINLSGHSIVDETFLEFVLEHFRKNPATTPKICFEITETAAIANIGRANRFIKALKQLGCHFALDDFGSGLASFAHLKTLPVDFLKIDGAFVRSIIEDTADLEMVRCINSMAQATGKQTIAEFVENAAILQKLREIGVDYAQGYAIERPQPLAITSG